MTATAVPPLLAVLCVPAFRLVLAARTHRALACARAEGDEYAAWRRYRALMIADDELLVDAETAAALAHRQPATIRSWASRGKLVGVRRGGRTLYRTADVLRAQFAKR